MRALITGAAGQLGCALRDIIPVETEVIAKTSAQLDITDVNAVTACVSSTKPDILINAAAYTAVDKAESDIEAAFRVNGEAVANLARAAEMVRARLIHVSTDFVFDGESGHPYTVDMTPSPLNVYGASKLQGEQGAGKASLIIRTAWVYSQYGHNFVRTMLRLMAERDKLQVVADQIGTPTWATSLAEGIWKFANTEAHGIYHYTDSGVASWYDFAVAIQEEALAIGLLEKAAVIIPIAASSYPTPARRPFYSVLDKEATNVLLGSPAPHWRTSLRRMLQELLDQK